MRPLHVNTRFWLFIGLIAILFVSEPATAANHFIRDGATGSSPCSDWTTANACDQLPASLVRGDTYYIADGTYPGYDFNDPESGTLVITIKKATLADHGSNVGWQDTFADGQALFTGTLNFMSDFYEINGQTRNENNWQDSASYGFRMRPANGTHAIQATSPPRADNLKFKYLDVGGDQQFPNIPERAFNILFDGHTDIYIGFCHLHNVIGPLRTEDVHRLTLEYSYIGPSWGKEAIAHQIGDDWIIRHNLFVDNTIDGDESGTADIGVFDLNRALPTAADNFQIYGNVFANTGTFSIHHNDAVVNGWNVNNWKVYNNVLYNIMGRENSLEMTGSNNHIYNTLWYKADVSAPGATTSSGIICSATSCENVWCFADTSLPAVAGQSCSTLASRGATKVFLGSENPFVDAIGLDFRLKPTFAAISPENNGLALGAGFDPIDRFKNTRGADGGWDIGAYELNNIPRPDPPHNLGATVR